MKTCPYCKYPIEENWAYCRNCNKPLISNLEDVREGSVRFPYDEPEIYHLETEEESENFVDFVIKDDEIDQKIKNVRGRGYMIGVELHESYKAADVVKSMYEKGVLIGTAGPQVVRFLPPYIVTWEELDKALKKFEQVIKKL